MPTPDRPRIYHIVHVDNLASIVGDGCLWPDAVMVKRQGAAVIGNNEIKADRLVLPVQCNPGTCVGDYVSHPGRWYGCFLNSSGLSLCQSFIACKGDLLPKADCGSCWL